MTRLVAVFAITAATAAAAPVARAAPVRGPGDALCTSPKSIDPTWHAIEAEGVSFRIPRGYTISGSGGDYRVYSAGQRHIGVEWGRGPGEIESGGTLQSISECRTVIDGRIVAISMFSWTRIDEAMAPSGDAGTKFLVVARFPSVERSHAVSVWIFTPFRGDAMQFRQVFWTVSFPSAPGEKRDAVAASPSPAGDAAAVTAATEEPAPPAARSVPGRSISASLAATNPLDASASATPMPLPQRSEWPESASSCPAAPPGAPAVDALVDTALVQRIANGSDPLPRGYGVVALTFDASGALAGVAVVESDLAAAPQRQLAAMLSSNVKPQPARSATHYLRVDTGERVLRYVIVRCGM